MATTICHGWRQAADDALCFGVRGSIGNLPLGVDGNVEAPGPHAHGVVSPESGGPTIALRVPSPCSVGTRLIEQWTGEVDSPVHGPLLEQWSYGGAILKMEPREVLPRRVLDDEAPCTFNDAPGWWEPVVVDHSLNLAKCSRALRIAGLSGFLTLIHSLDTPDR